MDGFIWARSHCDGNSGFGIPRPLGEADATPRLGVVLFGLPRQGFTLAPIAHRLGLVLPSEEAEPT